MSDDKVTMTEVERATLEFVTQHRSNYIASGGAQGHILDYTNLGGHFFTTTMLLETIGRKTGNRHVTPLIYGDIGGEVAIVASKGGADVHPAWYLNLREAKHASIQIATQAYRCTIREPEGDERRKIWDFMIQVYPPYIDYQAATARVLPIVLLKPVETIDLLTMPDAG